jgi:aspartyl/glutamyl-tRNA(Asn/Gln) amidotransferase C subunit
MNNVRMTIEEVKAIAKLVKLDLSDIEVEKFRETIPQTLDIIDVLKELDTEKVLPTSSGTGLTDVYADNKTQVTLSQELALSNAHEQEKGLFVTKAVFDRS